MAVGDSTGLLKRLQNIQQKDITYEDMLTQANDAFRQHSSQYEEQEQSVLKIFQQYFKETTCDMDVRYEEKKLDLLHDMFKIVSQQIVQELEKSLTLSNCTKKLYHDDTLTALRHLNLNIKNFGLPNDLITPLDRRGILKHLFELYQIYDKVGSLYNLGADVVAQYLQKKKKRNSLRHFQAKFNEFRKLCIKKNVEIQFEDFIKEQKLCRKISPEEINLLQLLFKKNCSETNNFDATEGAVTTTNWSMLLDALSNTPITLNATDIHQIKIASAHNCILLTDNNELKCFNCKQEPIKISKILTPNYAGEEVLDIAWSSRRNGFFILTKTSLAVFCSLTDNGSLKKLIGPFRTDYHPQCMSTKGEHLLIHFQKKTKGRMEFIIKYYRVYPNKNPEGKYEHALDVKAEECIEQIFLNDACDRLAINIRSPTTYTAQILDITKQDSFTSIQLCNDLQIETLLWSNSRWLGIKPSTRTFHLVNDGGQLSDVIDRKSDFQAAKFDEYHIQKICKVVQREKNNLIELHICN